MDSANLLSTFLGMSEVLEEEKDIKISAFMLMTSHVKGLMIHSRATGFKTL